MELYGLWSKSPLTFTLSFPLFPPFIVASLSCSLPDLFPLPLSSLTLHLSFVLTAMDSRNHNDGLKTKEGFKQRTAKDLLVEDDEEEVRLGLGCTSDKKRKGKRSCSNERIGVSSPPLFSSPFCQVEKCKADLTDAKTYHRRHKVCELHSKASVVLLAGLHQRFCQQCSRFHEVSEFDETKRSCRRRLAGHNERRRKSSSESHGEVSSQQGKHPQLEENHCRRTGETKKVQITHPGNAKHFQSR